MKELTQYWLVITKPVNEFIQKIPSALKPYSVLIFRSYALENQSTESDIDVIIVSEKFSAADPQSTIGHARTDGYRFPSHS